MSVDSVPLPAKPRSFRRLAILVVVALALACALLLRQSWLSRPIGTGPAGPTVARQPFEQVWTTQKVLLLGVGDSVTAGFGASKGHSYFKRLIANPDNEYPDMQGICLSKVLPNLKTRNIAVSGSTSISHLAAIKRLEVSPPDVLGLVVMTTGGNDIIHDYGRSAPREGAMYGATLEQARPWIDSFDKRLNEMLDRLAACFPGGCHVFLATIYDPSDGVGDCGTAGLPDWSDMLKIHQAYNDVIVRCAKNRPAVHLVNMHDTFLGHGIHCTQRWREHYHADDPRYWYFQNLEDPNDRGYDAIRRLFLIEMAQVVPAALTTTPATQPQ
jgi:lysophospholipase L1-like esterase